MSRVGPALAFYCRHGLEVDELWKLSKSPEGVSPEDWEKFETVIARASKQVEVWLEAGRKGAIGALAGRATCGAQSRTLTRDWFAWAQLKPIAAPRGANTLYAGVSIGTTPEELGGTKEGTTYYAPYLATTGGLEARRRLCERLVRAEIPAFEADSHFGDDAIVLKLIPLGEDSDLQAIVEESTACFRALAECWDRAFPE